jgi:outer membrane protein assembly factor BamB
MRKIPSTTTKNANMRDCRMLGFDVMIGNSLFLLLLIWSCCWCADWPMFRGNAQRTGMCVEHTGWPQGSVPDWSSTLGGAIVSSPAVFQNILYIGCRDSSLYAIDVLTGKTIWKRKTLGWVDATPFVNQGNVVFGSRDQTVYVLNRLTGDPVLGLKAGLQLSSPTLAKNGMIVMGLGPPVGALAAYDINISGWESALKPSWSVAFPQYCYSSPAVWGDYAVVGANNGVLYGINTQTQKTIWTNATKGGVYLSTPAIDDSAVFFAPGNTDYNVYAIDAVTGARLWASDGSVHVKGGMAKVALHTPRFPQKLFIDLLRLPPANRKGAIERLKAAGYAVPEVLTETGLGKKASLTAGSFFSYGEIKTSSVAVGPQAVYVVQKELGYPTPKFRILAINRIDGTKLWQYEELQPSAQFGYCASPVVTPQIVFIGWGQGRIFAFDAVSGAIRWSGSMNGDIVSSPAISNGNLYIASLKGTLNKYALSSTAATEKDFNSGTYCYPNPASGDVSHIQIYVDRHAKMTMIVYNMADKPVLHVEQDLPGGQKFTHDWFLKGVANGAYIAHVKVQYDDGSEEKKTVKIAVLH